MTDGKVLVMRTCDASMKSHGGFVWPKSGPVECPDWIANEKCGNGLHGLLWGSGDASLMDWSESSNWIVVEVEQSDIVDLGGKVKFPRGVVVYCGTRKEAADLICKHCPAGTKVTLGTATAGDMGTATAGDMGTATAGYMGTATAGDMGTILIRHVDGVKWKTFVGVVGEDGIKPNIPYKVVSGKLSETQKGEAE